MNPILQEALGSILRWGLAAGAGWLVEHGVWTSGNASVYVSAGTIALLSLGWSLWNKYKGRIKLLTALTMPAGTTEAGLQAQIKAGVPTPAVTTPAGTVPGVP